MIIFISKHPPTEFEKLKHLSNTEHVMDLWLLKDCFYPDIDIKGSIGAFEGMHYTELKNEVFTFSNSC